MGELNLAKEKEYVLGTGADELERLAFQHRLWSDAAHQAWKNARIKIGHRVLDVGCGPGFASFDLAQIVTRGGAVVGVDESATFIEHLNDQAEARHLPHLSGIVRDVHEIAEAVRGQESFDLAYARWVLCFVKDPAKVIHGVAERLRPGGRFVVHDYFHYQSLTIAPKQEFHDRAVEATMKSWSARGGNTDVAGNIPKWMKEAGFEVVHMTAHARVARPSDTMFHWPEVWWNTYAPKLVTMGYLEQAECDALLQHLRDIRHSNEHFIQCPIVYEFIAEKR
jgi:SAM-dependent methyltransferase